MQPVEVALEYCEENIEGGFTVSASPPGDLSFVINDKHEALKFETLFPKLTDASYRFLYWS